GDKRPFLSKPYMVTTIDSFALDFYGIPVREIFRSKWHSDLAFLLARDANLILDEFHLMTSIEAEDTEKEFLKVIEIAKDVLAHTRKKKIIMTATLSPSIIDEISPNATVLLLAPETHPFLYALKNRNNRVVAIWSKDDDFIEKFRYYTEKVRTYIVEVNNDKDICKLLNQLENKKTLVLLNHAHRVEKLVKGSAHCFIHGLFGNESKLKFFEKIGSEKVLFSTQVVEAGTNLDFDVIITDVAPAFALIQRIGRVCRYLPRDAEIYIVKHNIEKQIKGVYCFDITKKTIEELEKNSNEVTLFNKFKAKEIKINWRLAEEKRDQYDYLKLLLAVDDSVSSLLLNKKRDVEEDLKLLTSLTLEPDKVVEILDRKFEGSFIRSSSLFPLILEKDGHSDVVPVDVGRFYKLFKNSEALEFQYLVISSDKIEVKTFKVQKEKLSYVLQHPLIFMRKIMRSIRNEEKSKDNLSGYLKIVGKGFKVNEEKVGVEEINGGKYYYLRLVE
ncbi:MAG: helicase-related protein, partial [Thermoproteota archaeon]